MKSQYSRFELPGKKKSDSKIGIIEKSIPGKGHTFHKATSMIKMK